MFVWQLISRRRRKISRKKNQRYLGELLWYNWFFLVVFFFFIASVALLPWNIWGFIAGLLLCLSEQVSYHGPHQKAAAEEEEASEPHILAEIVQCLWLGIFSFVFLDSLFAEQSATERFPSLRHLWIFYVISKQTPIQFTTTLTNWMKLHNKESAEKEEEDEKAAEVENRTK